MIKSNPNTNHDIILLKAILYTYLLGSLFTFLLSWWEGDFVSVVIVFISASISIALIWYLNYSNRAELVAIIWLWSASVPIFILVIVNHFKLEIVLALLIPLLAAMLLSRRMLLIHGSIFTSIFIIIILYGYTVHPEYIFFSNINVFSTFLTLMFFMLGIAVIYHIYIQSAYQHLRVSNEEKEILLQEIHHRVKNNLNMMSSILGLQKKMDNPEVLALLESNRKRLDSIAMVHEILYDSKNFTHIDFKSYISKLVHHLVYACSKDIITIDIKSNNIILSLDTMANLGLIMQELLTNSLKYALNNGGEIVIC